MICAYRGLDPHKKVNGRKRQLLVDTGGRLWAAHVHAANDADGPAWLVLVSDILWYGERVEKVFGDSAYSGVFAKALAGWGRFAGAIDFERAARPESAQGFVPVAKPVRRCGWVVERSIAWTNFFRRIVKDYEYTLSSSVGWLLLANIQPRRRTAHVTTDRDKEPNLISQHALKQPGRTKSSFSAIRWAAHTGSRRLFRQNSSDGTFRTNMGSPLTLYAC